MALQYPIGYYLEGFGLFSYPLRYAFTVSLPARMPVFARLPRMVPRPPLAHFVRSQRKQRRLTQPALAAKAGVGRRFVRELEQGKPTLRLDKVNAVLHLFGYALGPVPQPRPGETPAPAPATP